MLRYTFKIRSNIWIHRPLLHCRIVCLNGILALATTNKILKKSILLDVRSWVEFLRVQGFRPVKLSRYVSLFNYPTKHLYILAPASLQNTIFAPIFAFVLSGAI